VFIQSDMYQEDVAETVGVHRKRGMVKEKIIIEA
jgi:hypothetical protein